MLLTIDRCVFDFNWSEGKSAREHERERESHCAHLVKDILFHFYDRRQSKRNRCPRWHTSARRFIFDDHAYLTEGKRKYPFRWTMQKSLVRKMMPRGGMIIMSSVRDWKGKTKEKSSLPWFLLLIQKEGERERQYMLRWWKDIEVIIIMNSTRNKLMPASCRLLFKLECLLSRHLVWLSDRRSVIWIPV